ncbi:TolC family protein [Roseateles sp. So40a]|uniref:TolC family protein n=1 Tax=Roseateles sp. So40a TaxID=3400226 RepID=UPI003A854248
MSFVFGALVNPRITLRAAALAAAWLPLLSQGAPLTLDQAMRLAVQRSEATRSARAGVASAVESARVAAQLPDPVLRAGIDNLPVSGSDRFSGRDSMTMKRVGISQEWLSAGKRAARQAVVDAAVQREAAVARASQTDVRLQTGLAFLDVYFARSALDLVTEAEHHAHDELEAARARLASATATSQEVLGLSGARGMAEDETAEARQQLEVARVALTRWIGASVDDLAAPEALLAPTESAYVANHPAVIAAERDVDLARADTESARTNRHPNWSWEVSYGQRSRYPDMVSVGISIPLAIAPAQRQDRELAAKLALAEKAEAQLAETTRMATGEYRMLAAEAARLAGRVDRYRTAVVLPAQQRTAVAMAAYRSNQVPLTTLFESRHAELEARRKLLALQRDLARAQASLAFKASLEGDRP